MTRRTGTGKTTHLSRQIARAVERFGAQSVLVTSFSRAAAAELAGRNLPIHTNQIGTLHSHCWHVLGGPEIAEAHVDEWNRDNPSLALTPAKKQGKLDGEEAMGDDESEQEKSGDELLQRVGRLRGMMLPRQGWPATTRAFDQKWEEYKRANGLMDFSDLIDKALRDIAVAPGNPSVIFADEAQDLNRMQLSLVRKWGERAEYFIMAGDDDQTIFTFTGATPEAFLSPDVPDDHKIILKQSYRVPRAVHHLAESMIHTVKRRQPKEYLPRAEQGAVERLSRDGYKRTEYEILKTAEGHLAEGKTVMFLAACSYMLQPLVKVLRQHGLPFHNPYRKSNGYWNPLRIGKRTSTAGRLLALLAGHPDYGEGHHAWTMADLASWAEVLQAKGILRHGVKNKLKAAGQNPEPVTIKTLDGIFEPLALESLMAAWDCGVNALREWWRERVTSDLAERVKFPAEIARRRGPHALHETPQVVVGTIHSVKGGQADCVVLFPDLSQAGDSQYARDGEPHDSVTRQFYVGVTRARERLYLCAPESAMRIAI